MAAECGFFESVLPILFVAMGRFTSCLSSFSLIALQTCEIFDGGVGLKSDGWTDQVARSAQQHCAVATVAGAEIERGREERAEARHCVATTTLGKRRRVAKEDATAR